MTFVVSALLAWTNILTYEILMMHKEIDDLWEVNLSLAKTIKQNIAIFDDCSEEENAE